MKVLTPTLSIKLTLLLLLFISTIYAQTGVITGRVYNAINNEPIMFANVVLAGTTQGATTDLDGNYSIENLTPGLYNIQITYVGFDDQTIAEIEVSNSKPAIVDVPMVESSQDLEEVVVKASPFTKKEESPVSLRTIGVAEIQRKPGGNRDISKVVQTLPGVTSTNGFRNDLLIRGGAPNGNRFYLDDVEVPNINHFATQGASGGPTGLINVDFIREVDFYSGAFPSNRGNALSSVFNFKQKDGRKDRIGATASLGSSDAALTLEGPIAEKTTFLFSARQSYLQFLFKALELPFLPNYIDFQTKIKIKLDQKNEIYFTGLGAVDKFSLNLNANETEEQQYLLDNLPINNQWNYTNGLVYKHYQENGYWTVVLSRNMLNNNAFKFIDNFDESKGRTLDYLSQEIENKLRLENTSRFNGFKVNYGVSYEFAKYINKSSSVFITPSGPLTVKQEAKINLNKYGLFGQVSRKLLRDRLILSMGVRMDGNDYNEEMSNPLNQVSPVFSLAYAFSQKLSINMNTGLYHQLPPYTLLGFQENGAFINKNTAKYINAHHIVAGLEYNAASNSKITLEGFYKRYRDYPFLLRDSVNMANLGGDFGIIGFEPAVSDKNGQSYGLEFLAQQRVFKGFYGILSYTLSWSEFEDKNGNYVASSWDSRHTVNLTAGKRFKKNWEVGLAWRSQSALPFTPVDEVNSSLITNWDVFGIAFPDYERLNTLRGSPANSLDLRVDKKWSFKKWSLNLYLDIENVYSGKTTQNFLVVERDDNGDKILDPDRPGYYKTKYLTSETGTALPTIGIIVSY